MRGQFSIDFFLVLSVILAFILPLYTVAVEEGGRARLLDSAILSKHAVDSVASIAEYAFLGGKASSVSREVFVPRDANCFFYNESTKRLYCSLSSRYVEGNRNKVESNSMMVSVPLLLQCGSSGVVQPGWYDVTAGLTANFLSITCTKVA